MLKKIIMGVYTIMLLKASMSNYNVIIGIMGESIMSDAQKMIGNMIVIMLPLKLCVQNEFPLHCVASLWQMLGRDVLL